MHASPLSSLCKITVSESYFTDSMVNSLVLFHGLQQRPQLKIPRQFPLPPSLPTTAVLVQTLHLINSSQSASVRTTSFTEYLYLFVLHTTFVSETVNTYLGWQSWTTVCAAATASHQQLVSLASPPSEWNFRCL